MKLLLIRHGQSQGNAERRIQGHADMPLTGRGRDQARALAQRLHHEEWPLSALYASDLSRAAETAKILAAPFGLPVISDERLREYDFGELNGAIWQEVEHLHPDIWRSFDRDQQRPPIPGEEGHQAFRTRLAGAMADITARHQDDEVVILVTHGGSLGTLLAHLLGMATRRPQPFRFHNASLSIVEFGPRRPLLALQNDTCHLQGDLR